MSKVQDNHMSWEFSDLKQVQYYSATSSALDHKVMSPNVLFQPQDCNKVTGYYMKI
jgi:hypothetical protein